jgi:hypothetical protein
VATGVGKRLAGIEKMRRWVLPIAILAAASVAALFLGAEAQSVQQGHQTERISGEGPCVFVSILLLVFDSHILVRLLAFSFLICSACRIVTCKQPLYLVIR